jgi:hypothetical protein
MNPFPRRKRVTERAVGDPEVTNANIPEQKGRKPASHGLPDARLKNAH